eukprot:TRINITY_DN3599_c0_g1_i3.p1 TRINITY_DN3599_c0_g1~~TRINITY_DN3599_c0_g1_i3.p1  ORF type:complete len:150 (+),score=14.70 TRINITY_DN3599_c0_g1_i3:221-670(+)
MTRFVEDYFSDEYIPSFGIDYREKAVEDFEGRKFQLRIYDTFGFYRGRNHLSGVYKMADAVLIVYDITNRESFDRFSVWMDEIKYWVESNPLLVLIGNKSDLSERRVVNFADGLHLAHSHGMQFFETSAKLSISTEEPFKYVMRYFRNR